MPSDPARSGGSLHSDEKTQVVDASREDLWQVILGIGGDHGSWSVRFFDDFVLGTMARNTARAAEAWRAAHEAPDQGAQEPRTTVQNHPCSPRFPLLAGPATRLYGHSIEHTFEWEWHERVTPVGTEVTLGAAGRSGRGYLSEPPLPGPGVVVVHDEFGLLPHVRQRCDWLAEAGFVALAVDLYGGRVADTPAAAERLAGGLDVLRSRGLLAIAATQLLARPKVRPQRVGAVGFGLGGRLALLTATTDALDAIVAFYAILTAPERSLVPCPTLLHLAGGPDEQDQATRGFLRDLRASGTDVTARTWSGVPPGFANADQPSYLEKPTVAAWVESAGFLSGHLRR